MLAAGASRRMGTPKALLDVNGVTFVARLVDVLSRGGCAPVIVVIAGESGALPSEVERCGGLAVVNPQGTGGQIGSLRMALEHVRVGGNPAGWADPPEAFLFTPVDNPAVRACTVGKVIHAWRESRLPIVMPRFGSQRGHPVLVDMSIADEFCEPGLLEGARSVVRRDPARVLEVTVNDRGTVDDIDTPRCYRERFGGRATAEAVTPLGAGVPVGAAGSGPNRGLGQA